MAACEWATFRPPPRKIPNRRHGASPRAQRLELIRKALADESKPLATRLLVVVNLAWFVVALLVFMLRYGGEAFSFIGMGLGGQTSDTLLLAFQDTGWLDAVDVIDRGQWWRMLSTSFLHAGALHLAFSMYGLFVLGGLLEKMWGRAGFLAIYLTSCLGTSAAELVWSPAAFNVGGQVRGADCWVQWRPGSF